VSTKASRQHVSGTDLAVWRSLLDVSARLRLEIDRDLQETASISTTEHHVLISLVEHEGHALRSSELAAEMGWERSRLSHQIRRMEVRGLIRRSRDIADSRGSVITLTPAGLTVLREVTGSHLAFVRKIFLDALDEESKRSLAVALARVSEHLDVVTPGGVAPGDDGKVDSGRRD